MLLINLHESKSLSNQRVIIFYHFFSKENFLEDEKRRKVSLSGKLLLTPTNFFTQRERMWGWNSQPSRTRRSRFPTNINIIHTSSLILCLWPFWNISDNKKNSFSKRSRKYMTEKEFIMSSSSFLSAFSESCCSKHFKNIFMKKDPDSEFNNWINYWA